LGQAHNIDSLSKRTQDLDELLKWKTAYSEIQRESKKEMQIESKNLSKRIENLEKTFMENSIDIYDPA
jgi:hypothetical protein